MKKIIVTTLAAATVLLTQVQAQEVQKDSITVEKSFKNSFATDVMKRAFVDAAAQESWGLETESAEALTFKKNFSQKSKFYNHAAFRGERKIIREAVELKVNMSESGFSMDLVVEDKNSRIAQEAQESMQELQKAVYIHLLTSTL